MINVLHRILLLYSSVLIRFCFCSL